MDEAKIWSSEMIMQSFCVAA